MVEFQKEWPHFWQLIGTQRSHKPINDSYLRFLPQQWVIRLEYITKFVQYLPNAFYRTEDIGVFGLLNSFKNIRFANLQIRIECVANFRNQLI